MRRLIYIGLLAMAFTGGCATQRTTMDDLKVNETHLFITRTGENVTLSWESKPDFAYTIYYNHTRSAVSPWKILPGFDFVRGTGRTLTYHDQVPVNETRYYRLQASPAVSLSP